MKTVYSISLDADKVNILKKWLDKRGLSFSGYLNSVIDEQIEAIELFDPLEGKKVTTSNLLKMASEMALKLNKEMKNENKGKGKKR